MDSPITTEVRFGLTIAEIEYASNIDENWELFHKAIDILKKRISKHDFSDCDDEEREILEETFTRLEH